MLFHDATEFYSTHTKKPNTHTHSFWFHLVSTFVRWNKKTHSTENNSRHTLERRMIYIKPKVNALRINWSMQKTFWNEFSWQLTHLKCAFQTVNALYFLHSQIVCIICCWSFAQNNAVKSIGMKQKKTRQKRTLRYANSHTLSAPISKYTRCNYYFGRIKYAWQRMRGAHTHTQWFLFLVSPIWCLLAVFFRKMPLTDE